MFGWFQKKKEDERQSEPRIPPRRMPALSEMADIYRHDKGFVAGVPNQLDSHWSDAARSVPVIVPEMLLSYAGVSIVKNVGEVIDGIRSARSMTHDGKSYSGFTGLWNDNEIQVVWMFLERIVALHNEVERLRAEQDQTVLELA